MDKKLNLEDYRKELKKRQLKEKIYSAVESGKNWAVQNKEEAITLAAGVCGCATAIIKTVGKRVNSQKEKKTERFVLLRPVTGTLLETAEGIDQPRVGRNRPAETERRTSC